MRTIYLDSTTKLEEPAVVTVGFFDGVHRGHQSVIRRVRHLASAMGARCTIVTFSCHPAEVLCPEKAPAQLSTLSERTLWLSQEGVDQCVVLPFTKEMSLMTAEQFICDVLIRQIGAKGLILGYDSRFGSDQHSLTFHDYMNIGQRHGIVVMEAVKLQQPDGIYSSSAIRGMLAQGNVTGAAGYLGRWYSIEGKVERGYRKGHRMGFPTANLSIDGNKLLPLPGVYAVYVRLPHSMLSMRGMLNIGTRPTFGDGQEQSIEVNILHHEDDLYGQKLTVYFVERIRDEKRFDSQQELMIQLEKDRTHTEDIFEKRAEDEE